MPNWKKPVDPPATLTKADSEGLPENGVDQAEMGQRTRPPLPNFGTWGDRVFGAARHTDDPKAPKVL
jgi:hypothetical protein